MNSSDVLGLIAGEGRLPFLVAAGAKQAGLRVICVGLAETAEHSLADEVDVFYRVAIARPGACNQNDYDWASTKGSTFHALANLEVSARLASI